MSKFKQQMEITGLKGLAAIIVMICHYMIIFFPASYNAEYQLSHFGYFEMIIHRTPLFFFMNGPFMVYIFWSISGYLLFYGWSFTDRKVQLLKDRIFSRYFKLVLPVLFSLILAFFLNKSGLVFHDDIAKYTWSNNEVGMTDISSFWYVVFDGVIGLFIGTGNSYREFNPVLWTIHAELYGVSYIALFLGCIYGRGEKKWIKYIFWMIFGGGRYLAFLLGVLVADINLNTKVVYKKIGVIGLFTSIILGSFPPIWKIIPSNVALEHGITIDISGITYAIAAGMFLFSATNLDFLKKILSVSILKKIGKVSMYIYLFHWSLMESLGCGCFLIFKRIFCIDSNYVFCAFIAILFSCSMTVCLCLFIEKIFGKIYQRYIKEIIENI